MYIYPEIRRKGKWTKPHSSRSVEARGHNTRGWAGKRVRAQAQATVAL